MSKIKFNNNTKLSAIAELQKAQEEAPIIPEKILPPKPKISRISSFSLKASDKERLNKILSKTQSTTQKKLSSTEIIRALLKLNENIDPTKLILIIKEISME